MTNSRGMTYVETLMAAVLLSVFIAPVLAGFFAAGLNQKYAKEAYEAALYANNLVLEAGAGNLSGTSFEALTENPDFSGEYKTELYDYCLYVYEGDGSLSLRLKTNSGIADTGPPVFTGDSFPQAPRITATGDYTLEVSGDTDIFVPEGGYLNLVSQNNTGLPALINIYAAPGSVTLNCGPDTTVFLREYSESEKLIVAEVYNKKAVLLSRIAVPVIHRRGV